jgi:hypothetical protein
VEGEGWTAQLLNALAALKPGESQKVIVYVSHVKDGAPKGEVTLQVISESDPSKTATATVQVLR